MLRKPIRPEWNWRPFPGAAGAVPQVVGMGIKEAIYLLEREGLRVAFSGTGCVRSQSIPAGAPAQRGALVVLQLGAGRPEVRPGP